MLSTPEVETELQGDSFLRSLRVAVASSQEPDRLDLYWLRYEATHEPRLLLALYEVLVDPLHQHLLVGTGKLKLWSRLWWDEGYRYFSECRFLPGVTDNLACTVREALSLRGLPTEGLQVASGRGYLSRQPMAARYNPLIEQWRQHDLEHPGRPLDFPEVHLPPPPPVEAVNLELPDAELEQLSRERLLALSLAELQAIRDYYRRPQVRDRRTSLGLPGDRPTDVELEVLAQTWSEHCKHKIFAADIRHNGQQIRSLYRTYVQAVTRELAAERPDLLSVFEDNAGVVAFTPDTAVCFKVETHNSPSALEPYGGALTGILGVNRDILGTGLAARPIFNTDVFCFAYPGPELPVRPKLLDPGEIMRGVRLGVEDGGNKSGIPTVNGAIFFDPGYRAKPLVFCGTGGLLPVSAVQKRTRAGDAVVMAGGRVGKDGIHGATFSSESLHEGSPVSAVQIGDPFTQKRLRDFLLEARDAGLLTGLTDNGAGGLSSSVGEMARDTGGATLELERVPTKYPGLADWEVVVSESQERMTLATRDFEALQRLARRHGVEVSEVGHFHEQDFFQVNRAGRPVACLDLDFLHEGVPRLELESVWEPPAASTGAALPEGQDPAGLLLRLLAHPNLCTREPVVRRYDHEVQGQAVIRPFMGPRQCAPCDAAVLQPLPRENRGLAVSCGLTPRLTRWDGFLMAVCAVDEAVRNAVCVGADPDRLSLLDNFCWPDPLPDPRVLGQLVRACQGLYAACKAFRAPLISGKDSMKNNFDDGVVRLGVPGTLLVSCLGIVPDVREAASSDFKGAGDPVFLLSAGRPGLAGSCLAELLGLDGGDLPELDLDLAARTYRKLHRAIRQGWVRSAHDLSEGGLAAAAAECCLGSGLGLRLRAAGSDLFAEGPGRILVSVDPESLAPWNELWQDLPGVCEERGQVLAEPLLQVVGGFELPLDRLEQAWRQPLPILEGP